MSKQKGFTIVELLVVIVVIGLLASIGAVEYSSVQQQTRDKQREAQVTLIASALERYYNHNGQYPPVYKMTVTNQAGASSLANMLNLSSDSLVMPNAPDNTYNSITDGTAGDPSDSNTLYYSGTGASCWVPQPVPDTAGCDTFTLSYWPEGESNSAITINSHSH